MKKTVSYLMLVAMILVMAAGCSKGNNDAESLIRTVPADAANVAVLNIARTIENLGCSTDGSTVKLSSDIQKFIDSDKSMSDKNRRMIKDFCEGKTGMAISSLVFFSASRTYVTGLLDDPDKFVEYMCSETVNGSKLDAPVADANGARTVGDFVVIGNQFWTAMEGTADAEQLKYYQGLNEQQSYASSPAASLLKEDKALTFVADVNKLMSTMREGGAVNMVSSLLVEDLTYVAGNADFDKKKLKMTAKVLDSDMKHAQLLLPAKNIDTGIIKSLGGNADMYFAAGLSKSLMKKIAGIAGSALGKNASQITGPLGQIDGTVAVRGDSRMKEFEAKVQTSGKDFAEISTLLQNFSQMNVSRDGDVITVSSPEAKISGSMSSSDAAGKLKGAWIGCVMANMPARDMTTVVRFVSEDKSLRLDVEMEGSLDSIMTELMK